MKRNCRKNWKKQYDMLRIVRCKGAVCVSINEGYDRYYAAYMKKRKNLKPITYYYEKVEINPRLPMGTTPKCNRSYMERN